MKLLIASDIHGSAKYARILQELVALHAPDKVVLLGDLLYHGPRNDLPEEYAPKEVTELLNGMKAKLLAVRGNCEAEVDAMVLEFPVMADYAVLFLDGKTVYATHGHLYGPGSPPPLNEGDILLCGHTHVGAAERREGFVYLNPGSMSIPKDGHHSYMLYEDGVFCRYDLSGKLLQRWPEE